MTTTNWKERFEKEYINSKKPDLIAFIESLLAEQKKKFIKEQIERLNIRKEMYMKYKMDAGIDSVYFIAEEINYLESLLYELLYDK